MNEETRGRKQNFEMINKVKKLKDEGISITIIADMLGLTAPMARYYARQEVTEVVEKKESIATCFFRQPREVQERIAKEIGYALPPVQNMDNVEKTYQKIEKAIEGEENSLLSRCDSFLMGDIAPNNIDEVFNSDEIALLQKMPKFVNKSREIFGGAKSLYSVEEVLQELKEKGVK